jgi:hypothetical protein
MADWSNPSGYAFSAAMGAAERLGSQGWGRCGQVQATHPARQVSAAQAARALPMAVVTAAARFGVAANGSRRRRRGGIVGSG